MKKMILAGLIAVLLTAAPVMALSVTGMVTNDVYGMEPVPPIAGAELTLEVYRRSAVSGLYSQLIETLTGVSGADGMYTMALHTKNPLPSEIVRYVLTAAHSVHRTRSVTLLADISTHTEVDLQLWNNNLTPAAVSGRTLRATNAYCQGSYCKAPLPGTRLILAPERDRSGSSAAPRVTVLSGAEGTFSLDLPSELSGLNLILAAEKEGYVPATSMPFKLDGAAGDSYQVDMYLTQTYPHSKTVTTDSVEITLATDQAAYNTGEAVFMAYTVKNIYKGRITYTFSSSVQAVFTLSAGGKPVWSSAAGGSLPVITTVTLDPGQTVQWETTFDMSLLNCGTANCILPSGQYTVEAGLQGYPGTAAALDIIFRKPASGTPEYLAVGHLLPYRTPNTYYLATGTSGSARTLYDIIEPTKDVSAFVNSLVKAFGPVEFPECLGCPPRMDPSAVNKVLAGQMLIEYVQRPAPPSSPVQTLTVYESGRATFLNDSCPLCDNVKIPQVDIRLDIHQLNTILDIFNTNGYWLLDSAYISYTIMGAPTYLYTCNGKQVESYALSPPELDNIQAGLDAFIDGIYPPVAVPRPSVAGRVLDGVRAAPRPFSRGLTVSFRLIKRSPVSLDIFRADGSRVTRLLDETDGAPGSRMVHWDGRDGSGRKVKPGVYYYQLTTGSTGLTKTILKIQE